MIDTNDRDAVTAWMKQMPGAVICAYEQPDGVPLAGFNLAGRFMPAELGHVLGALHMAMREMVMHVAQSYQDDPEGGAAFLRTFSAAVRRDGQVVEMSSVVREAAEQGG